MGAGKPTDPDVHAGVSGSLRRAFRHPADYANAARRGDRLLEFLVGKQARQNGTGPQDVGRSGRLASHEQRHVALGGRRHPLRQLVDG